MVEFFRGMAKEAKGFALFVADDVRAHPYLTVAVFIVPGVVGAGAVELLRLVLR